MTEIDYLAEARLGTDIASSVGMRLAELCQAEERATGVATPETRQRELADELTDKELAALASAALLHAEAMMTPDAEARITAWVRDSLFGHGGLQHYLDNPMIENIDANGFDNIWLQYADGTKSKGERPAAACDEDLIELVRTLAVRSGSDERRFDRASPTVNLQLADGSRLFAAHLICKRPQVSLRRHRHQTLTLGDMLQLRTIDSVLRAFLSAAVKGRLNILIAGGPGAGKTTLLRALAREIPSTERLITIEDTFELGFDGDPYRQGNVTAYQTTDANTEGVGGIDQSYLIRCALRSSPDRVIVGEVRGAELVPMCNAMSQGTDGSLATIHASNSEQVFDRLSNYGAQAPERLSREATFLMVASAVDLVVQLGKSRDGLRVVSSVRELTGADGSQMISNEVFRPDPERRARFACYPSDRTMDALEEGSFDQAWFNTPGWEL